VLIRRKDGRIYALTPEKATTSPLGIPTIKANISANKIALFYVKHTSMSLLSFCNLLTNILLRKAHRLTTFFLA
jgi:hypothetical protein